MFNDFARSCRVLTFAAVAAAAAPALAQERGLLDNLFGGQSRQPQQPAGPSEADMAVRINQLEAQIRQLTGTLEQLQFRNQQLEQQLRAQGGAVAPQAAAPTAAVPQGAVPAQSSRPPMQAGSPLPPVGAAPPSPAPATPGRRGDAFDPTQSPGAPGAPRALGGGPGPVQSGVAPGSIAEPPPIIMAEPPVGMPEGRDPGAPLDLSTLASPAAGMPSQQQQQQQQQQQLQQQFGATLLPPPPSRNVSATGAAPPTAPPSNVPKDYYDLAYGYVLRKDYAFAEDAFQTFLKRYPNDKLVPDAQFWLGESLFQRQRYDAAAEQFLALSTKHSGHGKAPDALLRLGQSLAALNQKEMACATLAEVNRKYPRASNSVKQGVEREQKRARC